MEVSAQKFFCRSVTRAWSGVLAVGWPQGLPNIWKELAFDPAACIRCESCNLENSAKIENLLIVKIEVVSSADSTAWMSFHKY